MSVAACHVSQLVEVFDFVGAGSFVQAQDDGAKPVGGFGLGDLGPDGVACATHVGSDAGFVRLHPPHGVHDLTR